MEATLSAKVIKGNMPSTWRGNISCRYFSCNSCDEEAKKERREISCRSSQPKTLTLSYLVARKLSPFMLIKLVAWLASLSLSRSCSVSYGEDEIVVQIIFCLIKFSILMTELNGIELNKLIWPLLLARNWSVRDFSREKPQERVATLCLRLF